MADSDFESTHDGGGHEGGRGRSTRSLALKLEELAADFCVAVVSHGGGFLAVAGFDIEPRLRYPSQAQELDHNWQQFSDEVARWGYPVGVLGRLGAS